MIILVWIKNKIFHFKFWQPLFKIHVPSYFDVRQWNLDKKLKCAKVSCFMTFSLISRPVEFHSIVLFLRSSFGSKPSCFIVFKHLIASTLSDSIQFSIQSCYWCLAQIYKRRLSKLLKNSLKSNQGSNKFDGAHEQLSVESIQIKCLLTNSLVDFLQILHVKLHYFRLS